MPFTSSLFLFGFLPLTLVAYAITPTRAKSYTLLVASLIFYLWGDPKSIWVILAVTAVTYLVGLMVGIQEHDSPRRKLTLAAGIAFVIALLWYFKYLGFFAGQLQAMTSLELVVKTLALPLGISFFSFQAISYMIDVYRGDAAPKRNPLKTLLYLSMFPQITAGPIVRYRTIQGDLDHQTHSLSRTAYGTERFILGLAKKLIIANQVGQLANAVYELPAPSTPVAWLGAIAYMLQIYFDFSGYSDMAIGLGTVLGFHFPENFNYPYIATSITDFWRRWHISLSTWFRDYVYIPLGGNRRGLARQLFNMAVVWALTGFWHGAKWTFLLWGLYYFVFLALEKTVLAPLFKRTPKALMHLYSLLVVLFGWVLFRAENLASLAAMLRGMLVPHVGTIGWAQFTTLLQVYWFPLLLALVFCLPIYPKLREKAAALTAGRTKSTMRIVGYAALLILFGITLIFLAQDTITTFIYAQF